MNLFIRLTRALHDEIRTDLRRPHAFALERIGFVFGRPSSGGDERVVLAISTYCALDDDEYLDDPSAGAVYSAGAIRRMRQRVLDAGESAFHVHEHHHLGRPRFSSVDEASLSQVVPSFSALSPTVPHGAIVFSDDHASAYVWWPGATSAAPVEAVSVVGFPLEVWRHG